MPTTSASRMINAPQDQLWAALADIENAGRWNSAWQRIELLSAQREGAGTGFRAHTEDGASFDFEITHWAPPDYIAFAPIARPQTEPYLLTLESQAFLLRPAGADRTQIVLYASASSRGVRGWFISRLFWSGYQKAGLHRALDAIQALFEPPGDEGQAEDEEETPEP